MTLLNPYFWRNNKADIIWSLVIASMIALIVISLTPRWMFPCEGGDNIHVGDIVNMNGVTGYVDHVQAMMEGSRCKYRIRYKTTLNEFKTIKVRAHAFSLINE